MDMNMQKAKVHLETAADDSKPQRARGSSEEEEIKSVLNVNVRMTDNYFDVRINLSQKLIHLLCLNKNVKSFFF